MADSRSIVKRWTWTATGLGVVLGPGVDALPLLMTWVGGYAHLARRAGRPVDEEFVKAALATTFAGFVQWYISGKIAQVVVAAVVAAAAAITVTTFGFGLLIGAVMLLSTNALINALFTYRFLTISANLLEDTSGSAAVALENAGALILRELMNLDTLGEDFRAMIALLIHW